MERWKLNYSKLGQKQSKNYIQKHYQKLLQTASRKCHAVSMFFLPNCMNMPCNCWRASLTKIIFTYLETGMNTFCKQAVYLLILHLTSIWRHCHVRDIDELRQHLLHVWRGLEQSLIDDTVDQWPTRLRACVRTNGGHFAHTVWLSACFLCTWFTLCFTPHLMQCVIF